MARDLVVRYDGDTAGADAASAKTRAQLAQTAAAADAMSKRFEAASKRAGNSGKGVGDSLLKSVSKAVGSQLVKSAGAAIGNKLADEAGRRIAATPLFQKLSGKAATAGAAAGTKLAGGVEKGAGRITWDFLKSHKLLAAGIGAGVLFGTRFGKTAEERAQSSFRPNFGRAFSGAFSGLKGIAGAAFTGVKYAALGAGVAVAGALSAAVVKGGARLDAIDSATGKLRGLGNSAKTTTKIMNDALASVKGTAFGLDEAATVSATAVAAGIKPGKELQRTLKLVADTATISGRSLTDVGSIFTQVATTNKVFGDTLNQLGDAGIPIVQLLGKTMHKSAGEVTELASKGKIDFKTFQKALEGGLGGAALKSGDTFQGALKNAGAAVSRFGAGILRGSFPQFKGVFGDITKTLDSLTPTATKVGKALGGLFSDATKKAKSFGLVDIGKSLGKGVLEVIGLVKGLEPVLGSLGRLGSAALKPFVKSLGGGKGAIQSLTDFVTTHQAAFTSFFVQAGHAAIGFGKGMVGVVTVILTAYAGLQKGIQAYLEGFLGTIQSTVRGAADIAASFGQTDLAATLGHAADGLQKLRDNNKASNSGDLALGLAKSLNDKLLPALDAADAGLTKVGKREITKAGQRDAANKTAQAIKAIGTNADGSALHLKRYSDISKLGAAQQGALRSRIKAAAGALRDQVGGLQAAGAGQKALTKAWQTGKNRLSDEFRQMGFSRKAAGQLAAAYAGVKPKVKTTVTAPGLKGAKSDTNGYNGALGKTPGSKVTKFSTPGLGQAKSDAQALAGTLGNIPRNIQIKINQSVATKGDRLAANRHAGGVWNGPDTVIRAASGRVLPGWSPGRDIHRFFSATAGELDLSGGEAIMRPEFTRAVGGAAGVDRLNRQAESGELGRAMSTGGVPALPLGPELTAPRRSAGATASRDQNDALVAAVYALAARPIQVDVSADHTGIRSLVQAEVREALRKRAS